MVFPNLNKERKMQAVGGNVTKKKSHKWFVGAYVWASKKIPNIKIGIESFFFWRSNRH